MSDHHIDMLQKYMDIYDNPKPQKNPVVSMDLSEVEQRIAASLGLSGYEGRRYDFVIMDDLCGVDLHKKQNERLSDIPDWKRPIPVKGPETSPSATKRAKLRAKRKKRK